MSMKKVFVFTVGVACMTLSFLSCNSSRNDFVYDEVVAGVTEPVTETTTSVITDASEVFKVVLPEIKIEEETQPETTASAPPELIQTEAPVVEVKGLLYAKGVIPRMIPAVTGDAEKKFSSTRVPDPDKPMIALTFDDGPSEYTVEIVDKLNKYGAAATFFVVGTQIQRRAGILKYIVESGSEIGNHTAAHAYLTSLHLPEIDEAIMEVQEMVFSATGIYPALVRPPYGSINEFVKESVMFPLILWSVDTLDWKYKDPHRISDYIMEKACDSAIILLHDSKETTKDAALIAIEKLISEGFQLVTVSELFQAKNIPLEPGNVYHSAK